MKGKKDQSIESLANEANKTLAFNKYLNKKIEIYKKYINLAKETLKKCFSDINKSSYDDILNAYINEIQKDYNTLKDDYEKKYFQNYQSLLDECLSDITMGKPILNECRANEFSLEYLKIKSEDIINGLKKSIKQSKEFHLFREPKRDSLIDTKKSDKEIEKITTELQQNMLYECKKINHFTNKINKYNYQINEIKKNINLLKNYSNREKFANNNNTISNNNYISNNISPNKKEDNSGKKMTFKVKKSKFKQSVNIGVFEPNFGQNDNNEENKNNNETDREGGSGDRIKSKKSGELVTKKSIKKTKSIKKKKNKIIREFQKVEDLFDLSNEEGENEKIIDDELHSDDESVFANKIKQPKKLTVDCLDEIKKNIPNINLKQIEYNKLKIIGEADEKSLQKRKFKLKNTNGKIKEIKKMIEKMNDKLIVIREKEKVMKEYIERIKENYEIVRPMDLNTSVYKKKVSFFKKNLSKEDIIEETNDEYCNGEGVGSDYENEQKEESDKEEEKKNNFNHVYKRNILGVKNRRKRRNKEFGKSVREDFFKNDLKNKVKDKEERAKSK